MQARQAAADALEEERAAAARVALLASEEARTRRRIEETRRRIHAVEQYRSTQQLGLSLDGASTASQRAWNSIGGLLSPMRTSIDSNNSSVTSSDTRVDAAAALYKMRALQVAAVQAAAAAENAAMRDEREARLDLVRQVRHDMAVHARGMRDTVSDGAARARAQRAEDARQAAIVRRAGYDARVAAADRARAVSAARASQLHGTETQLVSEIMKEAPVALRSSSSSSSVISAGTLSMDACFMPVPDERRAIERRMDRSRTPSASVRRSRPVSAVSATSTGYAFAMSPPR